VVPPVLLCFYLLIPGLISSGRLWYVQILAVFSSSLLPIVSFLLHTFGTAVFCLILSAFLLPEADREEGEKHQQTAACILACVLLLLGS